MVLICTGGRWEMVATNGLIKRCSICKEFKPAGEFNVNSGRKDGLQTHCRECSQRLCYRWRRSRRRRERREVEQARQAERMLLNKFYRAAVPATALLAGVGDDEIRELVQQKLHEAVLSYCAVFRRW
jgi:hypothetical protein